jgi:hypothetical protein
LGILEGFAEAAGELVPGQAKIDAVYISKLIKITQAAKRAHDAAAGQPLDLDLLKPVDPAT